MEIEVKEDDCFQLVSLAAGTCFVLAREKGEFAYYIRGEQLPEGLVRSMNLRTGIIVNFDHKGLVRVVSAKVVISHVWD